MLVGNASLTAQATPDKVRVFVLAGQSNMEGKGSVLVMNHQLTLTDKQDRFVRYKHGDQWIERDDVSIAYLGDRGRRFGKLTVGYGISERDSRDLFGPELGFGWVVGDHLDEQVLIIKTAWGGKSLDRDFRPPSRGYPDSITDQFRKAREQNNELTLEQYKATYGHFYRMMVNEVQRVTGDLENYFPDFRNQGFEVAGFVWFQGWNDQYAPSSVEDYQANLTALIHDLRKDLSTPKMPVVIGAMGHNGKQQFGKIKAIADAQTATAHDPQWSGRVVTVQTTQFWDLDAEAAFQQYWENPATRNIDKWREFGNDRPYHYLGSPIFFNDVGIALGEAMVGLLDRT